MQPKRNLFFVEPKSSFSKAITGGSCFVPRSQSTGDPSTDPESLEMKDPSTGLESYDRENPSRGPKSHDREDPLTGRESHDKADPPTVPKSYGTWDPLRDPTLEMPFANLNIQGSGHPKANQESLRTKDPLTNLKLQMNVDEEEWIELNQEMPEPKVRELSNHYCRNKFRTTQRIVKPSSLSPAIKDILVGYGLDNMSFGVGEVPLTTIVSVVASMNFSSD